MILRCTQKYLTELRIKKTEITDPAGIIHPLDEWYGHIFFLYPRRKCVIFMHGRTKFCFFSYDRDRKQLNDISGMFRNGIGQALFDEHYPSPVIKLFNERMNTIRIERAHDRRILGFINQRVLDLKCLSDYDPRHRNLVDERSAGLDARRNPMLNEKPDLAIEQMRDFLRTCPELQGVAIDPAGYRHDAFEYAQ
jgi:hypothetical protein